MAEQRGTTGAWIIRSGKAFVIHALVGLVVAGIAYWMTMGFDAASQKTQADYDPESVAILLATARVKLWSWYAVSFLVSWVAATIFLLVTNTMYARNRVEGRARLAAWVLLLLVVLGIALFFWWRLLALQEVGTVILPGNYSTALGAGFIGVILAYWLASAMTVTITMRPSVPLSDRLPTVWN
ncbi:hypothetical protein [Sphingomonas colocasiae]|uniref:Uncharacterized protein n=1 Tax=Sphingomonas colocasiae TaxID=1848973 RepID=A0ABS7PZV5_9SPHN|nr:hypothetical protein [Sphingomonas colocasiae]MBY8825524.1 hypothetical protein [Sphingomonas colocasiae]